ncbi:ribosome biogenesis protein BRX1 homolog isoform X2 [Sinocyclocheilus anshuiensis]|uniref:ribosome biogenesis protein BRX1 homolog isoform X2 n=1 Tax=Sinocyclocheilus anshuiensis TaxID=1608454 RepID=UPI0007BAB780|nr:PREDICTED: ribosome biogenesis protein BRX1 homolog isoform X2 [Sinocyclocheilus anshuiensis]
MEEDASLVEIGPRFVLNLIRIFQGSFGGPTLYESPHFEPPNTRRRMIRQNEKRREQQEVFWTPAEATDTQKQLRLTQMKRKGLP